jgi:hypothetical protein
MWTNIRLELAETEAFPRGSASRAFLLRVPLDRKGAIDGNELRQNPHDAICRRFWPGERDMIGSVVRAERDWALRMDGGTFCGLPSGPLILGSRIPMSMADGARLPFRVARVSELLSA